MNIAENFYFYLLDSLSDEIKIDINEFKKIYPFVSGVQQLLINEANEIKKIHQDFIKL